MNHIDEVCENASRKLNAHVRMAQYMGISKFTV